MMYLQWEGPLVQSNHSAAPFGGFKSGHQRGGANWLLVFLVAEDGFELQKWWNHEGPGLRGRTGPSFRGMEDGEGAGPGSCRGVARDKLGRTLRILSEKNDVEPQESEGKSDPQGWNESRGS